MRAIEGPAETMTPPPADRVRLDPKLMTHQRMLDLVGKVPLRVGWSDGRLFLIGAECGHSITCLDGMVFDPAQHVADVLRHQVMAHDLSLSGGGRG